jgi:hypothetical protein
VQIHPTKTYHLCLIWIGPGRDDTPKKQIAETEGEGEKKQ